MSFVPVDSLDDLLRIDRDPHVAVARCYNYIILMSESPQEAFLQAVQFGRLFVETAKWNKIEKVQRNYADVLASLSDWVTDGIRDFPERSLEEGCCIIFRSFTLKSTGYCLDQVYQDQLINADASTQILLSKSRWQSSVFDDVRSLTSSSKPLSGKPLKFAFHAGLVVYACYGKLLLDVLKEVEHKPTWQNGTLSFYLDVNYPIILGSLKPSGIWLTPEPLEILNPSTDIGH